MNRKRLDVLLVERAIAPSREKAKALVMEGKIFVNGAREEKAGTSFPEDAVIELRGERLPFVSRGGLKLARAVDSFGLALEGKVCIDIGASTGGFTDCMLQNGAARVYAIDVGYGQLDYRLRTDARVICMEKTNFRYLTPEDLPERADFAGADVSFISLDKILPAAFAVLKQEAEMVCLIKPQFEAGREKVGKGGIVRDPAVHREVIDYVMRTALLQGFLVKGLDFSPISGAKGNTEYLLYLRKQA